MLDLSSWPKGLRVIVRKERPHPGAQLRFTDIDGHRFTCFATNTNGGLLALTGQACRWEPKRLRLRIFSAAGRLVRGGRRLRLRLAASWPWAQEITTAITRLQALAPR